MRAESEEKADNSTAQKALLQHWRNRFKKAQGMTTEHLLRHQRATVKKAPIPVAELERIAKMNIEEYRGYLLKYILSQIKQF